MYEIGIGKKNCKFTVNAVGAKFINSFNSEERRHLINASECKAKRI